MRRRNRLRQHGEIGVKALSPPGRPPRLSLRQIARLGRELLPGPADAFCFHDPARTTRGIAEVIKKEFGISYHRYHVGRILHSIGWSYHKIDRRTGGRNGLHIAESGRSGSSKVKGIRHGWAPA